MHVVRVPLVHGFCFGITRQLIDRIGYFNEYEFPNGYGEENDYCFRATDAGFDCVLAVHTYVYHAKTKSYGQARRATLAAQGSKALRRLHGAARVARAVRTMLAHPLLKTLRLRAEEYYKGLETADHAAEKKGF